MSVSSARCICLTLALVALVRVCFCQSEPSWQRRQEQRAACIKAISSFVVDPANAKQPELPADLGGVTLEHTSSGCFGNCPAFKMAVEKDRVVWEGHAFVRKKKRLEKPVSPQVLRNFVQKWIASTFLRDAGRILQSYVS